MRQAVFAVVVLAACGGDDGATGDADDDGTAPDAAVDAAPDPSCRTFGALTRTGALATTSGQPFHPEGIVADPHVLRDASGYRMWFTAVDWTAGTVFDATDRVMGTAYATSADGLVWDDTHVRPDDPDHKVDLVLRPGSWDGAGVETVSAEQVGGELVLFHSGDRPDGSYAIGRARSQDGLTWTRDAVPVLDEMLPWEQSFCIDEPACTQRLGGLFEPTFVVDADGTQHVWYAAYTIRGSDLSTSMGHAWSTDAGVTWQRNPTPVFEPGAVGAWDEILVSHTNVVADPGGGYHLFYQGISRAQQDMCSEEGSCPFYTPGSIGHAFSDDGTTWTRDAAPLLVPEGADGFFVGGPSAIIRDGRVELFYFAMASRADATVLRAHLARATAVCN